MLTLRRGRFIPVGDIPSLFSRRPDGRRVEAADVYRWAKRGVGGVRLRTVRVAGMLFTTTDAVDEFISIVFQTSHCQHRRRMLAERRDAMTPERMELGLRAVGDRFEGRGRVASLRLLRRVRGRRNDRDSCNNNCTARWRTG